jgi:hypothetical protein
MAKRQEVVSLGGQQYVRVTTWSLSLLVTKVWGAHNWFERRKVVYLFGWLPIWCERYDQR